MRQDQFRCYLINDVNVTTRFRSQKSKLYRKEGKVDTRPLVGDLLFKPFFLRYRQTRRRLLQLPTLLVLRPTFLFPLHAPGTVTVVTE